MEVEVEVEEEVPASNLLSSNATKNADHDIGSSAVRTQSVMTMIKSKEIEAFFLTKCAPGAIPIWIACCAAIWLILILKHQSPFIKLKFQSKIHVKEEI